MLGLSGRPEDTSDNVATQQADFKQASEKNANQLLNGLDELVNAMRSKTDDFFQYIKDKPHSEPVIGK
jgi:ABC-type transporter Mla subunit MlaD